MSASDDSDQVLPVATTLGQAAESMQGQAHNTVYLAELDKVSL